MPQAEGSPWRVSLPRTCSPCKGGVPSIFPYVKFSEHVLPQNPLLTICSKFHHGAQMGAAGLPAVAGFVSQNLRVSTTSTVRHFFALALGFAFRLPRALPVSCQFVLSSAKPGDFAFGLVFGFAGCRRPARRGGFRLSEPAGFHQIYRAPFFAFALGFAFALHLKFQISDLKSLLLFSLDPCSSFTRHGWPPACPSSPPGTGAKWGF